MGDILIHHGILGQKWGVRRFQNEDGSLTSVGKKRYGVGEGTRNFKETLSSMSKNYKDKYDQCLTELKKKYSTGLNGKLSHEKIMDLTDYLATMQAYMGELNGSEETASIGRIWQDYNFRKSCELAGVNLYNESSGKASIQLAGLKLIQAHTDNNKQDYDDLLERALEYVAVYDAMFSMPNNNYLPYVQDQLDEYYEQIQDKDEQQKQLNKMMEELKKAGLYDLSTPVQISYVDSTEYTGLMYYVEFGESYKNFRPDQIKDLQKFAIENDLYGKDYRKTNNGNRTREKNVDMSQGKKKVTKRSKINISDQERSKKESNSKAALEKASKRLSDAIQDYNTRKQQTMKEREEKKKNYEMFSKRTDGYSESIFTKAKISVNRTLSRVGKKINKTIDKTSSGISNAKSFINGLLQRLKHEESMTNDILIHHGILNQKWGVRNGPPYPLGGGDYSPSEKKAIKGQRRRGNSIYNKKHFDEVLKKDSTTLSTLSYNKDRLKGADMYFANHDIFDKHQYNVLFNRPVPKTVYDESGNVLGTGTYLKYRIDTKLKRDMKVASEDSSAKVFQNLFKKDRDFYNFVMDPSRMQDHFVKEKYKFKGYSEAKKTLERIRQDNYKPTSDDLQVVYRMFNYVIPSDGQGNARKANDVYRQRTKLFAELKKEGYGAILDTNDAIYGGFKAKHPVIVFDMEMVIEDSVYQTKMSDKAVSAAALAFRKAMKI